jgi:hypothetical protein
MAWLPVARRGPMIALPAPRRCAGQQSQRKAGCHVQVTEHVPDRPGILALAAGVIALAWSGPTTLVLLLIVGVCGHRRRMLATEMRTSLVSGIVNSDSINQF